MIRKIVLNVFMLLSALTVHGQTLFGEISFDEALKIAKAENKKVFVDFYTQWCGPCKKLSKEIFPSKAVGDYLNSNFICLKLDAEKEGVGLAERIKVEAYPTIAVFNCDGELAGMFSGYRGEDEFIAAVENCCNPDMHPDRVAARYKSGIRDAKTVKSYAMNIMDSYDDYDSAIKEVSTVIDEYFNSLPYEERLKSENLFVFTNYTWAYSNPRLPFIVENLNKFNPDDRAKLGDVIDRLYYEEAMRYFSSNLLNNDDSIAEYRNFKSKVESFGKMKKLEPIFEFCEKRKNMTDEEYLSFCDDNFSKLGEIEQARFLTEINTIFSADMEQQEKRLSSFIRKYIGTLDSRDMYFAVRTLIELEKSH